MFIALDAQPTSGAVRRGGMTLNEYLSVEFRPSERRRDFVVPVYKHLTPKGVKPLNIMVQSAADTRLR
jgi:hypothetical protein